MKEKFSFLPTLKINLLRSFFAAIVISILEFVLPMGMHPTFDVYLYNLVLIPIFFLVLWGLRIILSAIKLGGIPSFLMYFITIPGDPLLFILFKIFPKWKIVEGFKFINFAPVILVQQDNVPPYNGKPKDKPDNVDNSHCPYKGYIIINKNTNWGGFNWSTTEKAFEIHDDWKVYSKGNKFGWIDRKGNIYYEPINKDVDLNATLHANKVANISSNILFFGNDKIGELINT